MNRTSISLLCMSLLLAACSKASEAEPMVSASSVSQSSVATTPAQTVPAAEPVTLAAEPVTLAATEPSSSPAAESPVTPTPAAAEPPAAPAAATEAAPAAAAAGDVVKGWKAWRAAACERCHGAAQEGMVGPSLIASLKVLSKDEFKKVVLEGRLVKGMPSHAFLKPKIDDLYTYLKGRSDGSVANVRPDGA